MRGFLIFLGLLLPAAGFGRSRMQEILRADSLALPLDEPPGIEADAAIDWPDEEDYDGYFRPASTENGSYLPMGQLARNLIALRFRARGYDNRYIHYEVNGAGLENRTEGFLPWQLSTALGLLPRSYTDVAGLGMGTDGIGGVGGITSLTTDDRYLPAVTRLSYGTTNRSYVHRATASTRLPLAGGRSLSLAGSYRGGKDGFVEGVFSDLGHVAFSITKRTERHTFTLTGAGVQGEQGVRSAATAEAFELTGTNYYNPNWGYQNGRVRNGKTRGYRQAFGALSWVGDPDEQWTLRASLSLVAGESRFGQPAWYDAASPYPDYYRIMPSFFGDPGAAGVIRAEWLEGNDAVRQFDWAKLYESNRYNLSPDGAGRSHYILRERVSGQFHPAAALAFEYRPGGSLTVRGGVHGRWERSDYFARLADLLGGTYWLDVDPFLLDDDAGSGARNDMRHPDRAVGEGDRFDYDYRLEARSVGIRGRLDYTSPGWQAALAIEAGTLSYRRTGRYEKELFPGALSYGAGRRFDFPEYTVKVEVFRSPRLRERIGLRGMVAAKAPTAAGLYVSPEYRHATIAGYGSEQILAAEAVYLWAGPQLRVDAAAYATLFRGGSEVRDFYDDLTGQYLNGVATGIDRLHTGLEAGLEWAATPRMSLSAVVSWGYYRYNSDPSVTLLRDRDGTEIAAGATAYAKNLQISGTPQTAALLLLSYRTRSYWRLEGALKYTGHNYVDAGLLRRMDRTLDRAASPQIRRAMLDQERLEDTVTAGVSLSKNFRLRGGHTLGLWLNADNLMDNRSIRTTGYEQNRFSRTVTDDELPLLTPFPSKYYYAYGANYYLLISYTF
jgi:hypothetical protein